MKSCFKRLTSTTAIAAAVAVVLMSLALVAPVQQTAFAQSSGKQLKIALVTDALFSDGGWGATAYSAGKLLESKYGYKLAYAENIAIPDIEATLRQYANDGYDLIIAHGFQWGDPAVKVGKDYPNTKFVVFTGLVSSQNVASIFPMQQEGTFLLGALAATMDKTGTIAYVGGDQYPNLINLFEGYKQGAHYVNPNIKVIGTYLGDWDNPAKGKEAGLAQVNAGADFLFHVADTSGHGVIEAAKEKGIYAFGAVADQNRLAPDTVLTSFVLDIDKAFDQAVQMVLQDKFEGKVFKPGIEAEKGGPGDGIVYLAPFHSLDGKVPADVKARLSQLTQDVIDKKIAVPERYAATSDIGVTVQLDGTSYSVTGISPQSKVTSVTVNPNNKSVNVKFDKGGDVELKLPTSMISGISMVKAGSTDVQFVTISSTDAETHIKFTVPDGSTSVDVYGTNVVPEFGVMAALLLAASLVAIIGLARFRGSSIGLGRL
ncbi:putative ABC uptake transporter, substrate-binding protein/surface lipoprotein [Nitrososphaera viennensis EN76]|nr:putative ABC uptake transporter, substrate-binding protein/surface lipoprotein [Nitrososphaera viennensis EN76]